MAGNVDIYTSQYKAGLPYTLSRTYTALSTSATTSIISTTAAAGEYIHGADILMSAAVATAVTISSTKTNNTLALVYLPASGTVQVTLTGFIVADTTGSALQAKLTTAGATSVTVTAFSDPQGS